MMRTYTIELLKKVPIAETDEAKWLVDTGCPFSYPNHRASIDGLPFEVEFGDEKKNPMFQMAVDKDAVIGYDFFKSFTVLLDRQEMRLSFTPAGK